jgi:hypothetical protein
MIKPDKNFRMHSSTKTMLAQFIDPHERGHFKRLMIQAQLYEEKAKKENFKRKHNATGEE